MLTMLETDHTVRTLDGFSAGAHVCRWFLSGADELCRRHGADAEYELRRGPFGRTISITLRGSQRSVDAAEQAVRAWAQSWRSDVR
jgi:hypothetical protein